MTKAYKLIQTLSDALAQQGYDTLTPVQEAVSDPALETTDLLVSAQTGSGKTVGFGLAIAPNLLADSLQFTSAGAPLRVVSELALNRLDSECISRTASLRSLTE